MIKSSDFISCSELFYSVAQTVYEKNPYWISENKKTIDLLLTDSAFFEQGSMQIFIVPQCARLIGFSHPSFIDQGLPYIVFGFWESINDEKINRQLFSEILQWARDQGISNIKGPINFATSFQYRLKLDHFDQPPFYQEPYNPSYYPQLLEQLNFQLTDQYYSWLGPMTDQAARFRSFADPLKKSFKEKGIQFNPLKNYPWENHLNECYQILEKVFSKNIAYTSISPAIKKNLFGIDFFKRLCPHTTVIATDGKDQLVGFFLTVPDYNPLLMSSSPKQAAEPSFELYFPQLIKPTLIAKTGGVIPDYRNSHLFSVMSQLIAEWGEEYYLNARAVMVHENNPSAKVARLAFAEINQHRYGMYAFNH